MTDDNHKHWYVLRAVFHREIIVRDGLRRAGFHCYVPMKYQVQVVKGKKICRLTPAVSELVFVHASSEAINDYKLHSKEIIYWLTKPKGNRHDKIIVSDKAMNDFIKVTQQTERSITYYRPEELNLNKGDHILIHGGLFDGVEGVLLKIKGKREKQLLVSIPDIAAVAVSIKPEIVELVSKSVSKSHDSGRDSKELIRLSTQMLLSAPDPFLQENEWNMLYNEICRLYKSLLGLKGYLPSLEGQIALALLLAERVMNAVTETTLQRCRNAVAHLRSSKLRDQLIKELEILS